MKIKKNVVNFPDSVTICQRVDDMEGDIYCGEVNTWDQLEHCILQALLDKDNKYYGSFIIDDDHVQDIDLDDPDIYNKVDRIYPAACRYPLVSFQLKRAIEEDGNIENALTLYEEFYDKIH